VSGPWRFSCVGSWTTEKNTWRSLPYVIALRMGQGEGVPTAQTADYGWLFLVVAGLLNYLIVFDAFDIARGRKP